jgi:outer membrane murein-binding lipoprotein Lpp
MGLTMISAKRLQSMIDQLSAEMDRLEAEFSAASKSDDREMMKEIDAELDLKIKWFAELSEMYEKAE